MLSGYTESSKLVHFRGPKQLRGHIVPVRIVESHTFSMIGELVEDPWISLAKDVAKDLLQEDAAKRFFATKKAMEDDPEVARLRDAVQEEQRALALAMKNGDDLAYAHHKKAYEQNKRAYEEHPLVRNLAASSEELKQELLSVVGELS